MRTNSSLLLGCAALCGLNAAWAAASVVLGRAVDQDDIEGLDNGCESAEPTKVERDFDTICLGYHWFQWTLSISRTLSGPKIEGRVVAAQQQHTWIQRSYQRAFRLFVLRPIDERAERERLGAEYYLVEASEPHYCIDTDPQELDLDLGGVLVDDSGSRPTYCFSLP
jgi:hypothetical protein